ncbi:MAG: hypothetical protein IPL41_16560 [Micropruina sp.]|nr:hypothetical protein [Micropruina sp.]
MTHLTITFDYAVAEDLDSYRAAAAQLESRGAEVTVQNPPPGAQVFPFVPVILGAVLAAAAVLDFVEWWRASHQFEQIITYKDGVLHVEIVPVKNGKIIVLADKDTVVELEGTDPLLDLTAIAKAALSGGAEAAATVARAAGAIAQVSRPTDQPTLDRLAELTGSMASGGFAAPLRPAGDAEQPRVG